MKKRKCRVKGRNRIMVIKNRKTIKNGKTKIERDWKEQRNNKKTAKEKGKMLWVKSDI